VPSFHYNRYRNYLVFNASCLIIFCRSSRRCIRPGVNFINVLRTAFTLVGPQSVKRYWRLDWVLTLWGTTGVKAVRRTSLHSTSSPDGGQLDEGRVEGDRESKYAQDLQRKRGKDIKFTCKPRPLSIDFGMFWKILKLIQVHDMFGQIIFYMYF